MLFGSVRPDTISIFYGKMGSGKTTNAMAQILDYHKRGLPVWCNFPINELVEKTDDPAPVYFEDDPAGILSMRGGLFVIDEAYLKLNSRKWASLPEEVFVAFTHARKLNMTIIVIAQSWMRIDKSIREISTVAREFRGSSLLGYMYSYVEYDIDELGEIVKKAAVDEHGNPIEYNGAHAGLSIISRSVYRAFETDFLFSKEPPHKVWRSAIKMKDRAAGGGATVQPAPLRPAPPRSSASEGGEGEGIKVMDELFRSFPPASPSFFQRLRQFRPWR